MVKLENKVSAVITNEQDKVIKDAIKKVNKELPFLINLTKDERKRLLKFGEKSVFFVDKAYELAVQNPGFLPRNFDLEEMGKDVRLFGKLYGIKQAITQLLELVDDTTMQVGSEAYAAALLVYQYAGSSNIGTEGLDEVVDDLGQRFIRKSKKTKESE